MSAVIYSEPLVEVFVFVLETIYNFSSLVNLAIRKAPHSKKTNRIYNNVFKFNAPQHVNMNGICLLIVKLYLHKIPLII